MNVFSGYISEGWRDFLRGFTPKPKAIWSCTFSSLRSGSLGKPRGRYEEAAKGCLELYFFESSQRPTWGASRSVWKGSRKRTGMNIFSEYISEGWRSFLQGFDQKPKAVRSCTFSSLRSGSLGKPRGRYEEAAKGCLELYFFGLSQQATWGTSRSVGKSSRRRTGVNIFPGYISEG